jgi:two-component system sensor histidine kinase UhpB
MSSPMESAKDQPLRILIVDDSADDVDLLASALRSQGYRLSYSAVDNEAGMRAELERQQWDVIVSDHSMPSFDAPTALAIAKELCPDVPFIVVSGGDDLDLAVALVKSGAQDYVQKRDAIGLGQVIERELRDARLIRERKLIEDSLRESQEIFRAIVENVGDLVAVLDTDGCRIYNSPSYLAFFNEEDIRVGTNSFKEIHPEDRDHIKDVFRRTVATGVGERAEFRFVLKDGSIRHIESEGRAIHDAEGKVSKVIVVSRDITERKRAERQREQFAARLELLSERLAATQENDRRRIAYDLHEQLGQELTFLKMQLQMASSGKNTMEPHFQDALAVAARALERVREMSLDLAPPQLDDLGLHVALRAYCEQQAAAGSLTINVDAVRPEARPPGEVERACFRVLQEALTNVLHHAQAREVWVSLRQSADELTLCVRDNGTGFDVNALPAGEHGASLGILSMEQRAKHAGGRLEIRSSPGTGTEVLAVFPLAVTA